MVIIRKAKVKDLDSVVKLWDQFQHDHDKIVIDGDRSFAYYSKKKKCSSKDFRKYAKKHIYSRNCKLIVAEDNNDSNNSNNSKSKLVGYSLLEVKKGIKVFCADIYGYYGDLFVKKEYRGKGVSSMFKDEGRKWFKERKVKYVALTVNSQNTYAHQIYKHWGFKDYHIEMRMKI